MYFSFQNQERAFTIYPKATHLTFEPHIHSHIELVYMRNNGKSKAFADGKEVVLEQGDLFVTFPNQIHYYQDVNLPLDATLLIASPDICPEYKKYFEKYLPQNPIFKNAAQNPIISNAFDILLKYNSQDKKFAEAVLRGLLLVILGEFLSLTTLEKIHSHNTDTSKDIINFCYENYTNEISLSSIAQALHISRYYVSHLFSNRLHISFNDYINSLRVRKACELLKSGKMSITEVALSIGYNSLRTFNRCFQKIKGVTPREYRINHLKKEEEASN